MSLTKARAQEQFKFNLWIYWEHFWKCVSQELQCNILWYFYVSHLIVKIHFFPTVHKLPLPQWVQNLWEKFEKEYNSLRWAIWSIDLLFVCIYVCLLIIYSMDVLSCFLDPHFKFSEFFQNHFQIRDIIVEFWRSVPALTLKLLSDPLVVAAIERCDQIIYRNMNGLLLPHVLVPLPSG